MARQWLVNSSLEIDMKNNKGLTLLEVLVSMLVLSFGILGLAPLVVLSQNANNISRDVVMVSELAKDKIEEYQNSSALPALPHYEMESGLGGGTYDRLYDRETLIWDNATDTLVPPGLCHIQVTISWYDMAGLPHSSVCSTVLEK
jgi:prepilin-type N-terminal cleavage/methylation domain-containing protein